MAKKTFQVSFPDEDTKDTLALVEKIQEAERLRTGVKPNKSQVWRSGVHTLAVELGLVARRRK